MLPTQRFQSRDLTLPATDAVTQPGFVALQEIVIRRSAGDSKPHWKSSISNTKMVGGPGFEPGASRSRTVRPQAWSWPLFGQENRGLSQASHPAPVRRLSVASLSLRRPASQRGGDTLEDPVFFVVHIVFARSRIPAEVKVVLSVVGRPPKGGRRAAYGFPPVTW